MNRRLHECGCPTATPWFSDGQSIRRLLSKGFRPNISARNILLPPHRKRRVHHLALMGFGMCSQTKRPWILSLLLLGVHGRQGTRRLMQYAHGDSSTLLQRPIIAAVVCLFLEQSSPEAVPSKDEEKPLPPVETVDVNSPKEESTSLGHERKIPQKRTQACRTSSWT
ncbi:hypothetical protein MLD38_035108 [Melastoma candidum]|uniref:Uncharacterized protein n=1 Tax=Melastoma candidum TaxID=119954 RepID=A0ACB9MDR8_9MYRT|nr:hypothetical protein MLD38_035108 [Melastoma candidum]